MHTSLLAPRSQCVDEAAPGIALDFSSAGIDREDTTRLETWRSTARRPADSSRREEHRLHSRPTSPCRSGTASRTAPISAPAPGSPRAANARPRAPPRCAREFRRRASAARDRRKPPVAATVGASAPPPAPPPPRARLGSSCTPSGGRGRASRCVDSPSNSTCGFASRRDRATPPTLVARTHCVVPQGQLSLAFSPHIVQVVRSFRAFALALTCSNSLCFFFHSGSSPPSFFGFIVLSRVS